MESKLELSKIGDCLYFPTLEEIPAVKVKEKDQENIKQPAKRGLSMAKKRFNQMAFSVLAQIIDEKQKAEDEEEDRKEKESEKPTEEEAEKETDLTVSEENDKSQIKSMQTNDVNTSITPRTSNGEHRKSLSRQGSTSSLAAMDSNAAKSSSAKKKPKKGPSFVSVIRLANLKRKVGGKGLQGRKGGAASVASSLEDVAEDGEFIRDLPREPRFCATFSKEAQYAMLKCYEDMLLESIRTTKPKEPVPDDATLYRVKTPTHNSLQSLRLAGGGRRAAGEIGGRGGAGGALGKLGIGGAVGRVGGKGGAGGGAGGGGERAEKAGAAGENEPDKTDLPEVQGTGEDSPDGTKPPSRQFEGRPSFAKLLRLPSLVKARKANLKNSGSSIAPFLPGQIQLVPQDKQLRLSYRFQTAMDILDAVREIQGQVVTTPRAFKLGEINPLRNYNEWSKGWSKEFQYELKKDQENTKT